MPQRTALIVGAGIGGLAASIALRRAGWRARIFERVERPGELGFALNLAANAMAALGELGVADRLMAEGHRTGRAEIRRGDGRALKQIHLSTALGDARALVATRPALHGALLAVAGADDLVFGRPAVAFETSESGVTLVLADGSRECGDVLIGADGVGSMVRRGLHPGEGPPRKSGYFAIRGVAYDSAHRMGDLSAATYLAHGIEASIAQAGANAVYWYMSLLAEDVTSGPASPAAVAERMGRRLDETFRGLIGCTRHEDMRLDELLDRDPIEAWGRGVTTLLGDAAHPMLPHTGQGAAQALEDAVALGVVLARGSDVPDALRRYERVRSARTRRLIERGRHAAWATTTKHPGVAFLRTTLIRLVPARRMAAMFMLASGKDPHADLRRMGE